jgi:hypothetical protein
MSLFCVCVGYVILYPLVIVERRGSIIYVKNVFQLIGVSEQMGTESHVSIHIHFADFHALFFFLILMIVFRDD